jgi:hypothetical protein
MIIQKIHFNDLFMFYMIACAFLLKAENPLGINTFKIGEP